ncbi:hypothetical protein C0Q70_17123 [Pomacea canaliculata]|uniref:CUB domain-containing protein n=1 Tax=Pomacea canaliculata TaxID=400727 RepID=A0A2T7NRP7_POMCA|nr:hypothetical protein C0Q70_17123 [Pomacea canaliculata]
MKLMLLLDVWIILHAQEVFMNYKKSCFGSDSEDSYDSSVDGIFPVGCTVQLKCQYYDCMAKGNNTFLYIEINNAELNKSVNVLARSGCDVEVLIADVTMDFDDVRVVCKDLLHPEAYRTRSLTIGYPPVEPENLTLIHSSNFLRLTFDKVKTGRELNDELTQWTIAYLWSDDTCSCSSVEEESRIVTCTIILQNAVDDGSHSDNCLSNVYKPILFIISAENKFGKMEISKSFSLLDYIHPPTNSRGLRHQQLRSTCVGRGPGGDLLQARRRRHIVFPPPVSIRAYTVQLFAVTVLGARSSKYSTVHLTPLKDSKSLFCFRIMMQSDVQIEITSILRLYPPHLLASRLVYLRTQTVSWWVCHVRLNNRMAALPPVGSSGTDPLTTDMQVFQDTIDDSLYFHCSCVAR